MMISPKPIHALIGAAIALAVLPTMSQARPNSASDDVLIQWDQRNVPLLSLSATGPTAGALFAKGALAAIRNQNAVAKRLLERLVHTSSDRRLTAAAEKVLGDVCLREGLYADAQAHFQSSAKLEPQGMSYDDWQTIAFLSAIKTVPPSGRSGGTSGSVPLHRDAADLARVEVQINGKTQETVVDTGANFSTVTLSTAKRLGLRILATPVTVGSSSKSAIKAQIGVADSVAIGGARLSHVVFIVLPDAALRFADGAYTIDAIIGLPGLLPLGRIEFVTNNNSEVFVFGNSKSRGQESDLLLDGLKPVVRLKLDKGCAESNLYLDSGAKTTLLNATALSQCPQLSLGTTKQILTIGGAGGSQTDTTALVLPHVHIMSGASGVDLDNVDATTDSPSDHAGTIGQDVLRRRRGYFLDFGSMTFGLLP